MPRNLDRRVEAVVPIDDPDLRARLDEVIAVELADDTLAWELVDDRWAPVERNCTVETHVELQEQAAKRSTVELR
jgi:polyphosphate kinase